MTTRKKTKYPVTVLHLLPELERGGAEVLATSIARFLPRDRFTPLLATLSDRTPLVEDLDRQGIEHLLAEPRGPFDFSGAALDEILIERQVAILHTHLPRADWAGASAVARLEKNGKTPPLLVQTRHNTSHFRGARRVTLLVDRRRAERACRILPVSPVVRDELLSLRIAPEEKIVTVPNGVDLERIDAVRGKTRDEHRAALAAELGIDPGDSLLLCVASLTEQKGHEVLLEAFASVVERHPEARLLLAGQGPLQRRIDRQAKKLSITERVHFLGSRSDVPALLAAADVAVQPSLWEGFGLAAAEALAAGLPTVVSRTGGLVDIVRDGETGLLVSPGSPEPLAHALHHMLGHPEEAAEMGRRASEDVRRRFPLSKTIERLTAIYEEILESPATAQ
jgi:glycosyltransferase involved in cell wall biosynthesis